MTPLTFRKHTVDQGLSDNCVTSVIQDNKGYIWFGTKNGLNRFDGHGYKTYYSIPGDSTSLGSSFINHIQLGSSDDTLWIATAVGVYIYSSVSDSFSRFTATASDGKEFSGFASCICKENDHTYWIATINNGLYRYDPSKDNLKQYTSENTGNGLPSDVVRTVYCDMASNIWIGTDKGLCRYQKETDRIISYAYEGQFGANEILSIQEDSSGNLWFGSWSGGIGLLNKGTNRFRTFCTQEDDIYISHAWAIKEYTKGQILIGSDDGLYIIDMDEDTSCRIDSPDDIMSLSDQNVHVIFRDQEGGFWFGTYFGGVNYLKNPLYYDGIAHYYPVSNGKSIFGKAVSCFCEDDNGNMWIATEDHGISLFDTDRKTFKNNMPSSGNSLSYHNIHSLLLEGDSLFIGTYSRGIDILNIRSGIFQNFQFGPDNQTHFDYNSIFKLFRSSEGEIYAGTAFGLFILDLQTMELIPAGLNVFVRDIEEDYLGNLWVATYFNGAFCRKKDTDNWINYMPDPNDSCSIVFNKLTDAYIDDSQRLWFASEGRGICKYNYETDNFTTIDESTGLADNMAYGILDDNMGNIWVSTNKGISRINPISNEIQNFGTKDGLQSNQFNYMACCKSSDGLLYFGGINGFNIINPTHIYRNKVIPPIHISSVSSQDREIRNTDGSPAVFRYNESNITVNIDILSFVSPENNRIYYRLSGIDKDWKEVTDNKSVTFYNLPHGKYIFQATGANSDGTFNSIGDSIALEIHPPVWESTMAYVIYIISLFSAITFIFLYWKNAQIRKQQMQVNAIKEEKEKELYENRINFFTNIAHEIRTPLSLIKAPLEIIINQDSAKDPLLHGNLEIIEKNTVRLTELVNQLLDFRKIGNEKYRIRFTVFDLHGLILDIVSRFSKEAESSGIRLYIEKNDETIFTMCSDYEAITKITSNIISNGLKYARSFVRISLENENGNMVLTISNDGESIPEEYREKIFEPFYRLENDSVLSISDKRSGTGIGLSLVRQLVTCLSGSVCVSGDESTTAFIITIPQNSGMIPEHSEQDTTGNDDSASSTVDGKISLLIAEDNRELLSFLKDSLSDRYTVFTATNGKDAEELISSKNIDMIVSDVMMPKVDGLDLIKWVRNNELYSHIPFILLSARTSDASKIEGLESGADSYIEKPFSIFFLKAQIKSMIDNRQRAINRFLFKPLGELRQENANRQEDEFIHKLNKLIEDNMTNADFSVREMANEMAVSQSNLQRKIKGVTGLTPNEYIRLMRLKYAATLLASRQYQINEVAYMAGFNTPSYFSKCFYEQFGMKPNEFIKHLE